MSVIVVAFTMLAVFVLVWCLANLAGNAAVSGRDRVKTRLARLSGKVEDHAELKILRKSRARSSGLFGVSLGRHIARAGMNVSPASIVFASLALFALAAFAVTMAGFGLMFALPGGGAAACLPVLMVGRRRAKRMRTFERQLPEALDLVARALKAGHTFAGGMRMVADEFGDPIGPEFRKTLEEINYGVDVDKALDNLMDRVDCPDLGFFVVSVNIQRETGGNLAEIVGNIATLVRERFKLHGKIKVLSAEGRISAMVLIGLPFAIAGVLYLINPAYMSLLFTNETGRMAVGLGLGLMVVGVVVIRRMIAIKV